MDLSEFSPEFVKKAKKHLKLSDDIYASLLKEQDSHHIVIAIASLILSRALIGSGASEAFIEQTFVDLKNMTIKTKNIISEIENEHKRSAT